MITQIRIASAIVPCRLTIVVSAGINLNGSRKPGVHIVGDLRILDRERKPGALVAGWREPWQAPRQAGGVTAA